MVADVGFAKVFDTRSKKKRRGKPSPAATRSKPGGVGLLILTGAVVVGIIGALIYLGENLAGPFLLFLLGLFAIVGIFTLFAGAVGLLRFGEAAPSAELDYPLLQSLEGAHLLTDEKGRTVFADRAYAQLIGATSDNDVRSVERVFGMEEGLSEPIYRLSVAASDGRVASEEVRLVNGLGVSGRNAEPPRWYRISVRPFRATEEGDEQVAKTIWRIDDITRDREDQEVAFQELQNVINYLDHAPAGFFSAEPDGRISYVNATLANWLGLDLADFEAGRLHLHDVVRGDGAALLNSVAADPGDVRMETIDIDFVKRSGQSLPVRLLHLTPFENDGAPGATRTIVLNRSYAEPDGSADGDARFSRFFNPAPIAISAVDRAGKLVRTNPTFIRLFGGQKRDLSDVTFLDLVAENDREKITTALNEAMSGKGEIEAVDAALVGDEDANARFFINAISGASDSDEASEMAVIYAIDTTHQHALEQQFAQGQKMQAVGQLAGGIAHDFNNLLTAIIGFSDLLLQNHGPADPSFQDIMNIKNNANRAAGLVRQLLAFSRRQTLRPTVIDLRDIVEDLSILLERLLGENVRLAVTHGRDLWPVKADLNQLEQVIINLSVNARDAMPDGGDLTITTSNLMEADCDPAEMKGLVPADYVMIEVTDTGTGMSPEIMAKIFEPFFSTKDVGKGTGLGLATVYGIMKQTGGYIYPISEVGVGTTFRLLLPRHIPVEEDVKEAAPVEVARDLSGSAKILLVEDEEAVRAFSARALQARGHTVHEAASGVEALEVMEEVGGEIDLVVSDVVMPEMDGPTLLGKLRETRPDLKIIFVSGYTGDAFEEHLPEGETFEFLPKPFSLKQLATKVKEVLDA
ncbi:MAG: ATP-binding protein [Pseudomonadota bacterium]